MSFTVMSWYHWPLYSRAWNRKLARTISPADHRHRALLPSRVHTKVLPYLSPHSCRVIIHLFNWPPSAFWLATCWGSPCLITLKIDFIIYISASACLWMARTVAAHLRGTDAKVRQEKAGWKWIPLGVKFLKVSRKELSVFAPRRKVFRKIRKVFESFSGVLWINGIFAWNRTGNVQR